MGCTLAGDAGEVDGVIDKLGVSGSNPGVGGGVAARPSPSYDPLRRCVQIMLAIYVSPVLLLVLLIGGVAMGFGGIARAIKRPVSKSA